MRCSCEHSTLRLRNWSNSFRLSVAAARKILGPSGITVGEDGLYNQDDWEVFMHFGRHSTGGPNDADVELVREQNEIQKDIAFCTLICMRQYFNNAFDKLD